MNDRRMQFAVGVVALGSIFVAVILMMINSPIPSGVWPWGPTPYQITFNVSKAPGVGKETPVRKSGILIGRVKSVDPTEQGVTIVANIDDNQTLTTRYVPYVRSTVLGDAEIDFSIGRDDPNPQALTDGSVIQGEYVPNALESISDLGSLREKMAATLDALTDASEAVNKVAERVKDAFGDDQEPGRMKRFLDTTEDAMAQFAQTMNAINQVIGDEPIANTRQVPPGQIPPAQAPTEGQELRSRLREGLRQLPDVITDARSTLGDTQRMVQSAERNFSNLEKFTQSLGERGPQVADSLVNAVQGLDALVSEFTTLAQALNRSDGTIGQLIHNPDLYQNLKTLTGNANIVLQYFYDLLKGLRPTIDNVRIFTDKIAREPGRLIGGAVNPSVVK